MLIKKWKELFKNSTLKNHIFNCFKNSVKADHFIPFSICIFLIAVSLFSSDYPITKVALGALILFFLCLVALCVYVFLHDKKQIVLSIKKKCFLKNISLWFVVIISFLFMITFIYTKSFDSFFGILKYIVLLWSAFIFSQLFSFKSFFKAFRLSFSVVCSFSLLMTLIISIRGDNFSVLLANGNYYNYYFVFFTMAKTNILKHNCAIFWEPGIFASFCCIALTLELLFDNDKWYKQLPYYCIFIIGLLSSGSLAGYFLLIVLVPFALNKFKNKITDVMSWIIVLFIIVAFLAFVPFFNFFIKVFPAIQSKGTSLTTRIYSLFVDFEIFKTSPIFGVGSNYSELFYSIASTKYPGLLDTSLNTFGYFIGAFGVAGILFTIGFLYSILFSKHLRPIEKIGCLILGLLIFSKEPHSISLLSMVLMFYFMKDANPFNNNNDSNPICMENVE